MSKVAALVLWGNKNPEGDLELSLELSDPWPAELVAQVARITAEFVAAGTDGAYPAFGTRPSASRLELVAGPNVSGNVVMFDLFARAVDGRAYQFLRQMAAHLEWGESTLRRIQVRERAQPSGSSPARLSLPMVDFDNEADMYPEPPARYGFAVEWPDCPPSKRRRVLIEVASGLERVHFDQLAEPIGKWAKLLEGCAFTLPEVLPDETDNIMGSTTLFDSVTAEVEVPYFLGSELAWDSLLNLLDAFSERTLRIVMVEVE